MSNAEWTMPNAQRVTLRLGDLEKMAHGIRKM